MGVSDGVRQRCRVAVEPHRDRAVTLHSFDGRKYQVIDVREGVRERLQKLNRGDIIMVLLEPVRCRGDGWRITRLDESTRTGVAQLE